MSLAQLNIHSVRNLRNVAIADLGRVNVFYGDNGSGKTSVLEAVHLLGMARSFRTLVFPLPLGPVSKSASPGSKEKSSPVKT